MASVLPGATKKKPAISQTATATASPKKPARAKSSGAVPSEGAVISPVVQTAARTSVKTTVKAESKAATKTVAKKAAKGEGQAVGKDVNQALDRAVAAQASVKGAARSAQRVSMPAVAPKAPVSSQATSPVPTSGVARRGRAAGHAQSAQAYSSSVAGATVDGPKAAAANVRPSSEAAPRQSAGKLAAMPASKRGRKQAVKPVTTGEDGTVLSPPIASVGAVPAGKPAAKRVRKPRGAVQSTDDGGDGAVAGPGTGAVTVLRTVLAPQAAWPFPLGPRP